MEKYYVDGIRKEIKCGEKININASIEFKGDTCLMSAEVALNLKKAIK